MTRDEAVDMLTKALCVNHDNCMLCQASELAIAELLKPRYDPDAVDELLVMIVTRLSIDAFEMLQPLVKRVRESMKS